MKPKRSLSVVGLCFFLMVGLSASNSYADEVTLEYESGIYKGEVSNGVPHGQGTFTFTDGTNIVGEWKDGAPWNGTYSDGDQNVIATYSDGVWIPK